MFEQNNNQERRKSETERVEESVLTEIDEVVRERHGDKEYHAPEHSSTVEKNSAEIFSIIEENNPGTITEAMERARKTGARGHDMYIETAIDPKTGALIRLRGLGPEHMPENVQAVLKEQGKPLVGNEEASAVELLGVVTRNDPDQKIYTSEVNDLMVENVRATYPIPSFVTFPEETYSTTEAGENRIVIINPDTKAPVDITEFFPIKDGKAIGLKMDQFIDEETKLGALAVAIGDLSQGGRFGSEVFRDEGNREFWESKPAMTDLARRGVENLKSDEKALLAKEVLGWVETQTGFLLHQKMRFERMLNTNHAFRALPNAEATKAAMMSRYSEWDRNILATVDRVKEMRGTFADLHDEASYSDLSANTRLEKLVAEMSYGDVERG